MAQQLTAQLLQKQQRSERTARPATLLPCARPCNFHRACFHSHRDRLARVVQLQHLPLEVRTLETEKNISSAPTPGGGVLK